jgi:penicillin V acylase-like amidase (Ntn superfamily)
MATPPRLLSATAAAILTAFGLGASTSAALACSRVTWVGPANQVMTNSPVFSEQLKLNGYWLTRDRTKELPGSGARPWPA